MADPAGKAERDWPHKAALPEDGFNLIFPCLLAWISAQELCVVLWSTLHIARFLVPHRLLLMLPAAQQQGWVLRLGEGWGW